MREQQTHRRGFAAMSDEKQRELSSKGGRASHGGKKSTSKGKRSSSMNKDRNESQTEHRKSA